MYELFQSIDEFLFRILNVDFSNPVFDSLMPFITTEKNWFVFYFFFIGFLLWKGGLKGRVAVLALLVTIVISDQFCSQFLKELFGRIRPCHDLEGIRVLVNCGAGKSLPSSHACNNFAAAGILAFFYSGYSKVFFSVAAIVAFSRIYVGVHYPFDALFGAIVGIAISLFIIYLVKIIFIKRYPGLINDK